MKITKQEMLTFEYVEPTKKIRRTIPMAVDVEQHEIMRNVAARSGVKLCEVHRRMLDYAFRHTVISGSPMYDITFDAEG